MKLSTPVPVHPQDPKIDHHSKVFLMGSCFVKNIGEKLDYYKFQNLRNPFGILYHPFALENFLQKVVESYEYTEADVFYYNERWHCFAAHSVLSNPDREAFIEDLNKQSQESLQFLQTATNIILTLGTSWVYRNKETREAVANCHKLPQSNFNKEITAVEEIERSLISAISYIKSINPNAHIIFTISPVRHLKDGVVENQLSKAHLITALQTVLRKPAYKTTYFPAYEIMMDELRDYRFYAEDMLHPNSTAIQFIWNKFTTAWCSDNTLSTMAEIEQIQRGFSHRPFNESSDAHRDFLRKLDNKIQTLNSQFPHIEFLKS